MKNLGIPNAPDKNKVSPLHGRKVPRKRKEESVLNGCSVCRAGKENYTTFRPAHRSNTVFYQYDYRDKRGNLFYEKNVIMESD
ncbi:MAG: DUF3873 domain-containing protein [Tannerella sp.]|jgi:hypothetical protein|nr:DUF3873 domain-containing protein [Tannerella sp.]